MLSHVDLYIIYSCSENERYQHTYIMMTDKESLSYSNSVGVDLDQKTDDDTCQVEDSGGMNPDNH